MLETIKQIRDFATATDNIYLLSKINILEGQIQVSIREAKIKEIKEFNNQLNNL
tara:strand:+ start:412 stop:573 length:162 start_codon:yes stop_codon:yes gene_type:complete